MKVAVVGAGPAGLYFAIKLLQENPNANVTLFDSDASISKSKLGLGYTLHSSTITRLADIDPEFQQYLNTTKCPSWTSVELNFRDYREERGRAIYGPSYGVTRGRLIQRLVAIALRNGCKLVHKRIKQADVCILRASFDIVVGADGVNSEVRLSLSEKFGAAWIISEQPLIWFKRRQRLHAGFRQVFLQTSAGGALWTEYRTSAAESTVVLEIGPRLSKTGGSWNDSLWRLSHDSYSELKGQAERSFISVPRSILEFPFRRSRMSSCERTAYGNVVLIGDAGFTMHHSIGVGVTYAIEAASLLCTALCNARPSEFEIQRYCQATSTILKGVQQKSLARMEFIGDLDHHMETCSERELVGQFISIGRLHRDLPGQRS